MIIFRQKEYASNPRKNPASYGYQSSIINRGGTSGTDPIKLPNSGGSRTQPYLPTTDPRVSMATKSSLDRATKINYSRERAKNDQLIAGVKGAQKRMNSTLKNLGEVRISSDKKNTANAGLYKQPTVLKPPISSNNRTLIRR